MTFEIDQETLRTMAERVWPLREPDKSVIDLVHSRTSSSYMGYDFDGMDRVREVLGGLGLASKTFRFRLGDTGRALFELPPESAHVSGFADAGDMEVVRDPDARADGWFGGPAASNALPEETDTEDIRRIAREVDPDGQGYSEEEIVAAEQARGGRFPAQLRAWFESTSFDGVEVTEDMEYEQQKLVWGLQPLPPAADEYARSMADGTARWPGWWSAGIEARAPMYPGVQAVGGSKDWIPFAMDGGGGVFCVDMVPADGGRVGQVILLPGRQRLGAVRVAESLRAALRDEFVARPTTGVKSSIGVGEDSYLSLSADDLRARLEAGDLPSTLKAVAVKNGDRNLDVIDALLEHWGIADVRRTVVEWQQDMPADD